MNVIESKTIQFHRSTFLVEIVSDDSGEKPWESDLGEFVSEWTRYAKEPGEMVLASDRELRRYFDFQAACKALRPGFAASPAIAGQTTRQRAATAAMAAYERFRSWCNDEWLYVGIVVTRLDKHGNRMNHQRGSLWGIESDSAEDYFDNVARDLAREINSEHKRA